MIWSIRGKLTEAFPQCIIVDLQGLALQVHIPASSYFSLPAPGQEVLLYTHLLPKEENFTLFGFLRREERDFFLRLLGVGGIGPKVALSLLGHLTIAQIVRAVLQDEGHLLTTIPGIGSKTASRICYELKEKLDPAAMQAYLGDHAAGGKAWFEVSQALSALGYSEVEIGRARGRLPCPEDASVEDLFKKTLALLAKK